MRRIAVMKRLIGAEIRNLQNLIARSLDKFTGSIQEVSLSGSNFFILKYLSENRNRDVFQRDIEKVSSITKSTCSKVLSVMESKGLITRSSIEDARFKKIEITPLGEELSKKIDERVYAHDKSLVEGLTEEQIQTFLFCIDTIKSIDNLEVVNEDIEAIGPFHTGKQKGRCFQHLVCGLGGRLRMYYSLCHGQAD